MNIPPAVVALAAFLAWASPGAAQVDANGEAMVHVGDSVRVRLPGALRVGAMTVGASGEMLQLRTTGMDQLWPISYFDLASLDVFRDRSPRQGFRHGAGIGLAVGLFAGAATGLLLHVTGARVEEGEPAIRIMRATFRFAGVGAAGGALVGGFVGGAHPGKGWVHVPLPGGGTERRR